MCKVPVKLRELVKQRLAAAAEEIFELLERTITEYEEEAERQRRLMETLLQPRVQLNTTERGLSFVQASGWGPEPPHIKEDPLSPHIKLAPLSPHIKEEQEEESSSQELLHRDAECGPEPPHIKEAPLSPCVKEEQEMSSSQEILHRHIIMSHLWEREDTAPPLESEEVRGVSVKSEEEEAPETWTQTVHHNQTVSCPEPPVPVAAPGDHLLHYNNRFVEKKTNKRQRKTRNLVKSHFCLFCGKGFPEKSALENHMRVHTGERPFSCPVCGKRFSLKGTMETHKKIHSGLKPYSCTVCGNAFSRKSHLDRHMLVHTGEKPFSCSLCDKQFSYRFRLNEHMSTHRETQFQEAGLVQTQSMLTLGKGN